MSESDELDAPDSVPGAAWRVIRAVFVIAAVALAFALTAHFVFLLG